MKLRTTTGRPIALGRSLLLPLVVLLLLVSVCIKGEATSLVPPNLLLRPPLLIVVFPGLAWDKQAAEEGFACSKLALTSVALMPVSSHSQTDPEELWVTLGAGRKAVTGKMPGDVLTGGDNHLNLAELVAANKQAHTGAQPGLLGTALQEQGYTTAVLALSQKMYQPAAPPASMMMLMDETGKIDKIGYATPDAVWKTLRFYLTKYDVVLLDLSGISSADSMVVFPALISSRYNYDVCFIGSPAAFTKERQMGWVALISREAKGEGLLTSPGTRWTGLIAPADFTATLLAALDGTRVAYARGLSGRTMKREATTNACGQIDALNRKLTAQAALEEPAGRGYAAYLALLVLAASCWPAGRKYLRLPALTGVLIPLGFLVVPVTGITGVTQLITGAVLALVGAFFLSKMRKANSGLFLALVLSIAVICADAVTGWRLLRFSSLGVGAMGGFRFYGIGNEYAGVLCACVCVGLGLVLDVKKRLRWLEILLSSAIALLLGAPWWGANWGGYMALTAGLLVFWVLTRERPRSSGRFVGSPLQVTLRILIALIALVVFSALPGALDLLRPEAERSHLGAAASAMTQGQVPALFETAQRKLAMNWRIAQVAGVWWLLAPVLLYPLWLLHRRWRQQAASDLPYTTFGLYSTIAAALFGLLINDSGIVLFGLAMSVLVSAVIFLLSVKEAQSA